MGSGAEARPLAAHAPPRARWLRVWSAARDTLRRPEARFPLAFLVLFAGASFLVAQATWLQPALQAWTARSVAAASSFVGLPATRDGVVVGFDGGKFAYLIDVGCTGLMGGLLFACAVLTFPAGRRARVLGVLAGLPALFLLNLLRLLTIAWIGVNARPLFEVVHTYLWQAVFILMTGVAFLVWIRLATEDGARPASRLRGREVGGAVATFLAVLALLWTLGLHAGFIRAYGAAMGAFEERLWSALWGAGTSFASELHAPSVDYAFLCAVVALFLATPRLSWRRRAAGALLVAVPLVFLLQAGRVVMEGGVRLGHLPAFRGLWILGLALGLGVPFAAWHAWTRWARDTQEPDRERPAAEA